MKWLLLSAIVIGVWYPVLSDNYDSSISGLANEEASKSGRESHDSVSRNSAQTKYCRKPAICEKLKNSTCFGVRLPYTSTSLDYVADVENQDDAQVSLNEHDGLPCSKHLDLWQWISEKVIEVERTDPHSSVLVCHPTFSLRIVYAQVWEWHCGSTIEGEYTHKNDTRTVVDRRWLLYDFRKCAKPFNHLVPSYVLTNCGRPNSDATLPTRLRARYVRSASVFRKFTEFHTKCCSVERCTRSEVQYCWRMQGSFD